MSLGFLFAMSLPALVAALFFLAMFERFVRGKKKGMPLSTAGIGELGATFEQGKRHELEFRKEERQLRDEEGDGAPPRSSVDLEAGTAVVKVPSQRQAG
ncbi:DUF6191 domain-containing protein [Lentzea sp. JNUCC 0626]|uniref:DUF6191 domain-containing protein n=1 Tax=Lentzea sp. JNUCC 0626 TaxID=3367513 RepID=UPI003747F4EC